MNGWMKVSSTHPPTHPPTYTAENIPAWNQSGIATCGFFSRDCLYTFLSLPDKGKIDYADLRFPKNRSFVMLGGNQGGWVGGWVGGWMCLSLPGLLVYEGSFKPPSLPLSTYPTHPPTSSSPLTHPLTHPPTSSPVLLNKVVYSNIFMTSVAEPQQVGRTVNYSSEALGR